MKLSGVVLIIILITTNKAMAQSSLPKELADSLRSTWKDESKSDSIRLKAIKKLTMDTCYSREVEKDNIKENKNSENDKQGEIAFRNEVNSYNKINKVSTLELSNALFFDVNNTSASNVIASASGGQLAMESNQYNNGVFIYAFINGLVNKIAALNKNGKIWLNELKEYTYHKVFELSKSKQQPAVRNENLLTNFKLR